jgi:glutathione synthase/RimK-type ligase-like ATP-grasp enzyme
MITGQNKFKVVILANEIANDHLPWVNACEYYSDKVQYRIVDLTSSSWYEEIISDRCDLMLAKPSALTAYFKQLYDERIMILSKELGYKLYPTMEEILIYENKRYLSFWLKANSIPHPKTHVFYHKKEAISFLKTCTYPIVGKTTIGASGNGVKILKHRSEATSYVNKIFTTGISARYGPRLDKGMFFQRAMRKLKHINELKERIFVYKSVARNPQKGFCLFQEYISHEYEWRIVRVGDSFFAYKKMKVGEKASGLMHKVYTNPPLSIMDFVKNITDKYGFYSMAIDIFEISKGEYLVNEMQCIWGQKNDYQLKIDNIPGRYIYNGKWIFEEGEFTKNKSYTLRLDYAIKQLQESISKNGPLH